MRTLLATAALTLALAAPASAEFFPVDQGTPQPCLLTPGQPNPPNVQVDCAAPKLVPVPVGQVKRIVAFKIRAIWGTYAAQHIKRYGCGTYELSEPAGLTTVCAVRFRTRRGNVVTRRIRLAYVVRGGRAGVLVSRVPRYRVPETSTGSAPTDTSSTTTPITTADPSVAGPTQVSDG